MRRLFQNESGVSGVEFAFVAPMLAIVLAGILSGWSYVDQTDAMRDSVEVGAKYYLQGGTSDATAKTISENAWRDKPHDGTVTVTRACTCAGAAANCSATCADGTVPHIVLTIAATGTWTDPFLGSSIQPDVTVQQHEVVRVR